MLGNRGTEQYRLRLGLLLASSGILLILWAVGSWIVRDSVPAQAQAIVRSHGGGVMAPTTGGKTMRDSRRDDRREAARALPLLLIVVLAVVTTLLVGGFVIVRAMRRHRIYLGHQRPPPTDSSDVWSMHRVPDYDDDDGPSGEDDRDDSGFGAGVS